MIRFPKRARSKSIDLEDGDVVELGSADRLLDPEDLVDTGVALPKLGAPRIANRAASAVRGANGTADANANANATEIGSSLAPVALTPVGFSVARMGEPLAPRVEAWLALVGPRPSLPWAAVLLALGAIGAAVSMRALDALDHRAHADAPAAAVQVPAVASLPPLAAPAVAPRPVVLKFGSADAVTVAVDAPKPAPAPPAAAPAPVVVVAPATGALPATARKVVAAPPVAAVPPAPPAAAPAPSPDAAKGAATVDSLAQQQLKAALK